MLTSYLNLTKWARNDCSSRFSDLKSEAQRGWTSCPKSQASMQGCHASDPGRLTAVYFLNHQLTVLPLALGLDMRQAKYLDMHSAKQPNSGFYSILLGVRLFLYNSQTAQGECTPLFTRLDDYRNQSKSPLIYESPLATQHQQDTPRVPNPQTLQ